MGWAVTCGTLPAPGVEMPNEKGMGIDTSKDLATGGPALNVEVFVCAAMGRAVIDIEPGVV